jgi:hypothetical protein
LGSRSRHSSFGTIEGEIVQVGGPSGAANKAVSGEISVTDLATGQKYSSPAESSAGYSIKVPVGKYKLSGTSSEDISDGHPMNADASSTVEVRTDQTDRVNVYIQIR